MPMNLSVSSAFPTRRFGGLGATFALSLAGSMAVTSIAQAELPWSFSANIGAVSNYMWRGMTQSSDQAAVQGGLDVAHDSGFYAGTWASNVDWGGSDPNYELDLYAGYDFTLPDENASLGLNTAYYAYPDAEDNVDFWEIGLSGGYSFFSAGIQYTAWGGDANEGGPYSEGDLYYSLGLDFPLPQDFGLGVFGGYYDFKDDDIDIYYDDDVFKTESADFWHWGATVSKEAGEFGTFSFTYEQNGGKQEIYDDKAKFWVGWSKEF